MVYGSCSLIRHRYLSDEIINMAGSMAMPWLVGGDFNCISTPSEKKGGNPPSLQAMEDFNVCISASSLNDAGFIGSPFTWSNNRTGLAVVKSRLDRFLINNQWDSAFPGFQINHLVRGPSDHAPLLAACATSLRGPSRFIFQSMWIDHETFRSTVQNAWRAMADHHNPLVSIHLKLKVLKGVLRCWNKNSFGNIHDNLAMQEREVKARQEDFDSHPT
ncbi:hypothetical protein Taro_048426 [Colocasia esculenta]|uniref:Endonuclease/exonuclease/phosphatase domain-containing protein n=1 Tax=Colocasia esculenta TaxID=4460 RepID=A0A843X872_COLES|nr:hypothetical protein [Colocasia esculenta]